MSGLPTQLEAAVGIVILQPALPVYRHALFERLWEELGPGLTVYSSHQPELGVLDIERAEIPWLRNLGAMKKVAPGLAWQEGALSIPLKGVDTLVVSGAPRTISTLLLMLRAKRRGVRIVWWGHYWSSTSKPWRAKLRFALMRMADVLLFYTDKEVEECLSSNPIFSSKPVIGLNNGLDTSEIARLRSIYSPKSRSGDLLFIGRLTEKANMELLLKAISLPQCRGVSLDVVGGGALLAILMEIAASLGVSDRVRWHGAIIDEYLIAEIANQCKIFVYPGSVGLSLIHGMAYGLPAIVHDQRLLHMPEIAAFENGVTGEVFDYANVESLAETICGMLARPSRLQDASANSIDKIKSSFNIMDMTQRFIGALKVKP